MRELARAMEVAGLLDYLPLWAIYALTVLLALASLEGGYRVGLLRHRRAASEQEAPVGAMVGATLGLLALVLAFTFGLAAERHDTRRQLLREEANAIGTAYRRAALLPESHPREVRALLREYTDARLDWQDPRKLPAILTRSDELHGRLWTHAVAAGKRQDSEMTSLFVASLNDLIDLHSSRVTAGLDARIPSSIWFVLYAATAVTMGSVGYHAGLAGMCRSPAATGLVLIFALIMILIDDLDRPREGLLQVSQRPMAEVRRMMDAQP